MSFRPVTAINPINANSTERLEMLRERIVAATLQAQRVAVSQQSSTPQSFSPAIIGNLGQAEALGAQIGVPQVAPSLDRLQ